MIQQPELACAMNETPPTDPHSEKAIFLAGLELSDIQERAAYLEKACGSDRALRERIERLIGHHACAETFLTTAVDGRATLLDQAPLLEGPGSHIGRYKLLQQIGEGGCGTVFMAEQEEPVRRRVALKVIKLGMDTKSVVARFEAERQALAMMDHPHIAKVLDGGATGSGRPYFVMELVRGIPITRYCDEHKLDLPARLNLFILVCQAIQHAHQKGIIHRDIKPSNILVGLQDGRPVPKVIDFGIAKATEVKLTERTLFTAFEQFIGTPAYMSPEQAGLGGLDIDTRSDVYTMGVLLYELITGTMPFDARELFKSGLEEIRRHIREVEAPRPSTRLSTLKGEQLATTAALHATDPGRMANRIRGDLDWIVMKCLEKARARRYETVTGLAADLRRHLDNEPVAAGPPSVVYRCRKALRRNRTAFAVGASFAAILVVATIFSAWQAGAARDSAARERTAREDAEGVVKFLTDVFRSPDPERDGHKITVAETLGRAAKRLETDNATQPERQALWQSAIGETYFGLGLHREALALQEKVLEYHRRENMLEQTNALENMRRLGLSYYQLDRFHDAIHVQQDVMMNRIRILGPEHPDTLASKMDLAATLSHGGVPTKASGRMFEQVYLARKQMYGADHKETQYALRRLEEYQMATGQLSLSNMFASWQSFVAKCRREDGDEKPDTILSMMNLANGYLTHHRQEDAMRLYQETLGLSRKVMGTEHGTTLVIMQELAQALTGLGLPNHLSEAMKLLEEALPLSRNIRGEHAPKTIKLAFNLAEVFLRIGRQEEAVRLCGDTFGVCQHVSAEGHRLPNHVIGLLAQAASKPQDLSNYSLQLLEAFVDSQRKLTSQNDPPLWLEAMDSLANVYDQLNRRDDAIKLREEWLPLHRGLAGSDSPQELESTSQLANAYAANGRSQDAIQLRNGVVELQKRVLARCLQSAPASQETIDAYAQLGRCQEMAGRPAEAIKSWQEAIRIDSRPNGNTHYWLGRALVESKRYSEAIPVLRIAQNLNLIPERKPQLAELLRVAGFKQTVPSAPTVRISSRDYPSP